MISPEAAYNEACRLVGEYAVREQMLVAEIQRLSAEVARLNAPAEESPAEPATD